MHLGKAVFAWFRTLCCLMLRCLMLCFLMQGLLACTLTSDPFNPKQVQAQSLAAIGDEPAPLPTPAPPVTESDAGEIPECSNAEAPGCELPFVAPELECSSDLDCESRVCVAGSCALPSCSDGRENADESSVDCGGGCPERCAAGDTCRSDQDCQAADFCPAQTGECTPASCGDGARNGSELAVDCGGGTCPGCPPGTECNTNTDCSSQLCGANDECAAPSCDDGVKNQDETDLDCGGSCGPCVPTQGCLEAADCSSAVCTGEGCSLDNDLCCQAPSCDDDVQNGAEPQIDCGNGACGLCPINNPCSANGQCTTNLCQTGLCRPQPCFDGQENGNESDVDCGGTDPLCRRCQPGEDCLGNADCASNLCTNGACVNCFDGVRNGTETGVDCGGVCLRCPGEECDGDNGCASGVCEADLCCGGDRVHCTRCALFLADDIIDCESNGAAAVNDCEAFLQCLADNSAVCSVQSAPGCIDNACPHASFGGDGGPGLVLATQILVAAQCDL